MASYRLIIFGLGLGGVGIVLIFYGSFINELLSISASVSSSGEAEAGRNFFSDIYDGLAWVMIVLAAIFVISGTLEDRAFRRT